MKKAALLRAQKCEQEHLCKSCDEPLKLDGCGNPIADRDCHPKCARAIRRAIASGKLTDDGEVAAGHWSPQASPGRKPTNPATIRANAS